MGILAGTWLSMGLDHARPRRAGRHERRARPVPAHRGGRDARARRPRRRPASSSRRSCSTTTALRFFVTGIYQLTASDTWKHDRRHRRARAVRAGGLRGARAGARGRQARDGPAARPARLRPRGRSAATSTPSSSCSNARPACGSSCEPAPARGFPLAGAARRRPPTPRSTTTSSSTSRSSAAASPASASRWRSSATARASRCSSAASSAAARRASRRRRSPRCRRPSSARSTRCTAPAARPPTPRPAWRRSQRIGALVAAGGHRLRLGARRRLHVRRRRGAGRRRRRGGGTSPSPPAWTSSSRPRCRCRSPSRRPCACGAGPARPGALRARPRRRRRRRRLARLREHGGRRRRGGLALPRAHAGRGDRHAPRDVVVATNYPLLDRGLFFARMEAARSYLVAARVRGDATDGMLITAGPPSRSLRSYRDGEDTWLLVGGEGHLTGSDEAQPERFAGARALRPRALRRHRRAVPLVDPGRHADRQAALHRPVHAGLVASVRRRRLSEVGDDERDDRRRRAGRPDRRARERLRRPSSTPTARPCAPRPPSPRPSYGSRGTSSATG